MKNAKIEMWIDETANVKKNALTIFLISSFIGTCAEMRKLERVREFRLFTSYRLCTDKRHSYKIKSEKYV